MINPGVNVISGTRPNTKLESREIKERTKSLLIEYSNGSDAAKRNIEEEICKINLPLLIHTLDRMEIEPREKEDAFQTGLKAMLEATRRYELARGFDFSTFCVKTVKGMIKNNKRDTGWLLKVPRPIKEAGVHASRLTEEEITQLDIPEKQKSHLLKLIRAKDAIDLDFDHLNNISDSNTPERDIDDLLPGEISSAITDVCGYEGARLIELHFVEGYNVEELSIAFISTPHEIQNQINKAAEKCREFIGNDRFDIE